MDPAPSAPPTCYRHPDRATRLSCSNCSRPICVECSRDSVVGQKCPDCARPDGRARVIDARRTVAGRGRTTTPVVLGLIIVNAALWLLGQASDSIGNTLYDEGAHWTILVARGEWWRAITATFLHDPSGPMHILFNMWALWLFGPVLERRFGSQAFAALYLAAGIGGSALFQVVEANAVAVGASGAIFGLFGALITAAYRNRHTAAGAAVFNQLAVLLVINALLPFAARAIAWEAHLGGFLVGAAISTIWERGRGRVGGSAGRVTVAVLFAAAALLVVIVA